MAFGGIGVGVAPMPFRGFGMVGIGSPTLPGVGGGAALVVELQAASASKTGSPIANSTRRKVTALDRFSTSYKNGEPGPEIQR